MGSVDHAGIWKNIRTTPGHKDARLFCSDSNRDQNQSDHSASQERLNPI